MSRLFHKQELNVQVRMLQTLCVLVSVFAVVVRTQFVIDRGDRDVFRNMTACNDATPDFCYEMNAVSSPKENCVCKCKLLYPMYRNPDVYPSQGKYISKGKPGCVWYANHRYECFHIRKYEKDLGGQRALEFNFSRPGSVDVHADYDIQSCSQLEASIKFPDEENFRVVHGLLFAQRLRHDLVKIQWIAAHKDYDGALIRGVFKNCASNLKTSSRCFVAKISGVYNDDCRIRTETGGCCIFPFTHKGKVYNTCTSNNNTEPWCAVRLRYSGDESNWWGKCASSPAIIPIPSVLKSITQTPALGATFSAVHTAELSSSVATTQISKISRLDLTSIPSLGFVSSVNNGKLNTQAAVSLSSNKTLVRVTVSAYTTPSVIASISSLSKHTSSIKEQKHVSESLTNKTTVKTSLISPSLGQAVSIKTQYFPLKNFNVLPSSVITKASSIITVDNLNNNSVRTKILTHGTPTVLIPAFSSSSQFTSSIQTHDTPSKSAIKIDTSTPKLSNPRSSTSRKVTSVRTSDIQSNNSTKTDAVTKPTPVVMGSLTSPKKTTGGHFSSVKTSERKLELATNAVTNLTPVIIGSLSSSKKITAVQFSSFKTHELNSEIITDTGIHATPILVSSLFASSRMDKTRAILVSTVSKAFSTEVKAHPSLSVGSQQFYASSASSFKGKSVVQTTTKNSTGYFTKGSNYNRTDSIDTPSPSRSEVSSKGETVFVKPTKSQEKFARRQNDIGLVLLILAVVGGVTFITILLVCCVVFCIRNKKKKNHNLPERRYRSFEMIDSPSHRPAAQSAGRYKSEGPSLQTSALNGDDKHAEDNEIEFTIPEQDYEPEDKRKRKENTNLSFITFKL